MEFEIIYSQQAQMFLRAQRERDSNGGTELAKFLKIYIYRHTNDIDYNVVREWTDTLPEGIYKAFKFRTLRPQIRVIYHRDCVSKKFYVDKICWRDEHTYDLPNK